MLPNLKVALAVRGIRQLDLASRLRVSPATISAIMHGRRQASASERESIAQVLNAEEHWLFQKHVRIPAVKFGANDHAYER